ncbi:MAG: LppX_LprAFG lipoprotein [Dehalococcoidia bacterium]|nr:LppX_LprAFG lipoprotein [Dehalococcoidia bacterium]
MKQILLFGLMLALLVCACGKDEDSTPTLSASSLTPEEIIATASPKLDNLTSFHFALSQEGGGTPINMGLEMTGASGDIAPPDKLKMKIEATWGRMFVEAELITVGTVTYMTNPLNSSWELLSEDFNAVSLFQPGTGIKAVMESVTGLSMMTDEKSGGVICFHMSGTLFSETLNSIAVGHAAEGLPVRTDIWIGVEDFLLRKVVFDGRICEDEKEGIIRTLDISRFNQPVTIQLPE